MNKKWTIQSELKKVPTVIAGHFSVREKVLTKIYKGKIGFGHV